MRNTKASALRDWLRARLAAPGAHRDLDEVIITSGSPQGIGLVPLAGPTSIYRVMTRRLISTRPANSSRVR